MSRGTERSIKAVHEFLAEHATEDMTMEEVNELLNSHMTEINSRIPRPKTEKDAKTAEDYIDLAEQAEEQGDTAKALRFAREASKLDPEDLDAELMVLRNGGRDPLRLISQLRQLTEKGRKQLEKEGYFEGDAIGEFWGILETRPYMRVRDQYFQALREFGMFRLAAAEGEDMIRLNKNDNLGIRYNLMHIYAHLEDAEAAEKLLKKYDEGEEGQMLLPLTFLYYKIGETGKAEKTLKKLIKLIPETKQFLRDLLTKKMEYKLRGILENGGYRPCSEEELLMAWHENGEIYDMASIFFYWAANTAGVKTKS